jgi:hypothetical protein
MQLREPHINNLFSQRAENLCAYGVGTSEKNGIAAYSKDRDRQANEGKFFDSGRSGISLYVKQTEHRRHQDEFSVDLRQAAKYVSAAD